jgi:hypothetical protein
MEVEPELLNIIQMTLGITKFLDFVHRPIF